MLIHVLQGERERARDNWSLGRFTIEFEQAAKGVARVGVQFEIDADGILKVLARDVKTGKERIVELKSAVDVDDADVQRMVEESVEHAFDDLSSRRWIEARLRVRETIQLARRGLSDCGPELMDEQRARIDAAVTECEAALATGDQRAESGDLKRLTAASAELDQATEPLADLLMDRAVEAMLRKRGIVS